MLKGIDYAWGKPGGLKISELGYEFVCRYLSLNPGKNITLSEVKDLHAHGIEIVLVWETTELRPLTGAQGGIDDATQAKKLALSVGWPPTRPIYFACDFDFTIGQQPKLNAYFKGVATVLPFAQIGVYGGYYVVKRLLDAGLCHYCWQTSAWSGGRWEPRANIKQVSYNTHINNVSCDINQSVTDDDFGQW